MNTRTITIIVIAIVLAGLGGYVLFQKSPVPVPVPSGGYADQGKWKTLTDKEYSPVDGATRGYMLSYPRDFDVYRDESASGGYIGVPSAEIRFPENAFQIPKTNFNEAYLTASIGADPDSLKNCYANPNPDDGAPAALTNTAAINGNLFYKGVGTGAAAGNIYMLELYRTLANDRCYEFVLTVHTGNIANYPTGTVVEFDKEKAFGVLRQILNTVTFYKKSGTPPVSTGGTGTLAGAMTIGPICPVERIDNPCLPTPEMFAARKIFVYASDQQTLVSTITPDAEGKFSVSLASGDYWVSMPKQGVGFIRGIPQNVHIDAGKTATLTIAVDTGIR